MMSMKQLMYEITKMNWAYKLYKLAKKTSFEKILQIRLPKQKLRAFCGLLLTIKFWLRTCSLFLSNLYGKKYTAW